MRRTPNMHMDFTAGSPWRRTTAGLLAIGVVGAGLALWQRHGLLAQRALAVSRIEAPMHAAPGVRSAQPMVARPEALDEVHRLVADLQRPWEPMLNALQAAVKDDVIVLRVQPEADAFRLRISGQADSSQAFVAFLQRLQGDASWRTVEPLSEAVQADGVVPGGKPLSFQLVAEWRRP